MDSKIYFEMISFVVEAIRERCASFRSLPATVSEICGRQTNVGPTYFSSIDILTSNDVSRLASVVSPPMETR